MTVIIDIDHEGGNLGEYTSTVEDSGDLSVQSGAALAGTSYGLQLIIDDTVAIYGEYDLGTSNTSGTLRFRFYIDPNGLSFPSTGSNFIIVYAYNSTPEIICDCRLVWSGTSHQIRASIYLDTGGSSVTSDYNITDDPHYVEILLIRSTGSGDNNGSLQLWIDGVSKQTLSSKDNYDRFFNFDTIQFGAVTSIDGGTDGTFYLDELIVNDDGSEIGPVAPSTLSASTSDGLTLGESMQSVASLGNIDVALDNANYQGRGVRII